MDNNIREKIIKLLDEAISEAETSAFDRGYHQGATETKRELLKLLGSGISDGVDDRENADASVELPSISNNETLQLSEVESTKPASERQRAPRGLVPVFVKRVLLENRNGITPIDFAQFASDEFEEMIKLPSIRSELNKGRADGRYKEIGGVWYLADDTENEEAESLI